MVEFVIATAVGLALIAAMLHIFAVSSTTLAVQNGAARLHHQLTAAATVISRDYRRAGYWGEAESAMNSGRYQNPFETGKPDTATCALLRYDRDQDGREATNGTERYGYALVNGTVKAFVAGAAFDCAAAVWIDLTDPDVVQVTELRFTNQDRIIYQSGASGAAVRIRTVVITLTGRLRASPSVVHTIRTAARLRNDWIDQE